MRTLLAAAGLALLAACATQTPYQEAAVGGGYGYREQQIESNRVRISFRGNSVTDRETVETYLLYRAAETTLQRGKDYFVIADRDTDSNRRIVGTGGYGGFGGYGRYYGFSHNYYAPRFGWGPWYDPFWGDPVSYREITRYESSAEISMFNGPKPADNPQAYDAREVQQSLHGRVTAPPAG